MSVTSYFASLRLSDEVFGRLIIAIERGVSNRSIFLEVSPVDGLCSPRVIKRDDFDRTLPEIQDASSVIFFMDQLLTYSFALAPDSAIRAWAARADSQLADVAIKRVATIRTDMPLTQALWQSKTRSLMPVLVETEFERVTINPSWGTIMHEYGDGWSEDEARVAGERLHVTLSTIRGALHGGRLDTESLERTSFALWPSDLEALIEDLQLMRYSLATTAGHKKEASE